MPTSFNPYRQPRPRKAEILARGRFFLADEHGDYQVRPQRLDLVLCREYLWVDKHFSIPLSSIRRTQLSKHGGTIYFWDGIEQKECRFDFTKVGFLVFRQKRVAAFLAIVNEHLPTAEAVRPTTQSTPALTASRDAQACEVCQSRDCKPYVFETLEFVGFVLLAYRYALTPWRYVLCSEHARRQVIRTCAYTAFWGSLGFPGFLAVPYYVGKNILVLRRGGASDAQIELLCFVTCGILPIVIIAMSAWALVDWLLA